MNNITYPAVIEGDSKKGWYSVFFPDLDGCISGGETIEQASINAHEALSLHIEGMIEDGENLPEPTPIKSLKVDDAIIIAAIIPVVVTRPENITIKKVSFGLPTSLYNKCNIIARESGISKTALFEKMIRNWISDHHP